MLQFTCACIKDAPIEKKIQSHKEMAVAALAKKKAAAKQEE